MIVICLSGHHAYSYRTPENSIVVNVSVCVSIVVSVDTVSNAFRCDYVGSVVQCITDFAYLA